MGLKPIYFDRKAHVEELEKLKTYFYFFSKCVSFHYNTYVLNEYIQIYIINNLKWRIKDK